MSKQTLTDHITTALNAMADRVLTVHPERVGELAGWLTTAHEKLVVRAVADRTRTGRIDTRSYRLDAYVSTDIGVAPLVSVRRRDIQIPDGYPDDPQAECRLLLQQNGHGIPNDLSGLSE